MCVSALFKKVAGIFKMKFYSNSPFFPIDYIGSMKNIKQTIMKDLKIQSYQWMVCDGFMKSFLLYKVLFPLFSLGIFSKKGYLFIGYR